MRLFFGLEIFGFQGFFISLKSSNAAKRAALDLLGIGGKSICEVAKNHVCRGKR